MNARRCTLLLVTASSLTLAGCVLKQPPYGADIMELLAAQHDGNEKLANFYVERFQIGRAHV